MPALTQEDVIVIDNYNSVKLDEYNGKYSLCAVDNGQNETYYMKWSYPKVFKNGNSEPGEKMLPVKVIIGGDKEQAIMTLEQLLEELKGGATQTAPAEQPVPVPVDSIPF